MGPCERCDTEDPDDHYASIELFGHYHVVLCHDCLNAAIEHQLNHPQFRRQITVDATARYQNLLALSGTSISLAACVRLEEDTLESTIAWHAISREFVRGEPKDPKPR